jgi:hypothetical protein
MGEKRFQPTISGSEALVIGMGMIGSVLNSFNEFPVKP